MESKPLKLDSIKLISMYTFSLHMSSYKIPYSLIILHRYSTHACSYKYYSLDTWKTIYSKNPTEMHGRFLYYTGTMYKNSSWEMGAKISLFYEWRHGPLRHIFDAICSGCVAIGTNIRCWCRNIMRLFRIKSEYIWLVHSIIYFTIFWQQQSDK